MKRDLQGRIGLLVVGLGFLGRQRAAAARLARGTHLVGVCDRDSDLAAEVGKQFGVPSQTDLRQALALPGVEGVVIATPHADHAEPVRLALQAGKHVLCEKPLTIRADEARDLAGRAEARKLKLATGLNHRFYPPVREALALVADRAIGRVESLRAQIGHRADSAFLSGWHGDPARSGGGTLMDNGPHACDLIRLFLGEVVSAQGLLRRGVERPQGCEVEAFALFRNHDQGVAELRSSWELEDGYLTIDLRGSSGHLRIETAPWRLSGRLADGHRLRRGYLAERVKEKAFRWRHGCERSLVAELEAFVADPRPFRTHATGWDGCRATEMVQAVYESARSGQAVRLAPLPVVLPGARRPSAVAKERP